MTSFSRYRALLVVSFVVCFGCGRSPTPNAGAPPVPDEQSHAPRLRETMGADGVAILKGPTRVEVFRVSPDEAAKPAKDTFEGYPILATGKAQDQAFAARLASILLGDGVTQNAKKCGLQPGVAYRIWNGDQAVDLLICFQCNVLWPHVVGRKGKKPWEEWQDFDPVRADLLALAKEAFPGDQEIQKLSKRGEPASARASPAPTSVAPTTGRPSWFAIGPEVYHESEFFAAEKRVLSLRLEPRWFVDCSKIVSKSEYDRYIAESSALVNERIDGPFFIPVRFPYPNQLEQVPLERHGVSLKLDVLPGEEPSVVVFKLNLESKDLPIHREVEHRWTNTLPLLFAFFVDGRAFVATADSFSKEGGLASMMPLVNKGETRKWSVKVNAKSLQAILPDGRPHSVAVAAAFANTQHEGYFEGRERRPSDGYSRDDPPILVRSNIARLKWDGTKWLRFAL